MQFLNKICVIQKNVRMENHFPKWGLHIFNMTFFDKVYILCKYSKSEIQFFNNNM